MPHIVEAKFRKPYSLVISKLITTLFQKPVQQIKGVCQIEPIRCRFDLDTIETKDLSRIIRAYPYNCHKIFLYYD